MKSIFHSGVAVTAAAFHLVALSSCAIDSSGPEAEDILAVQDGGPVTQDAGQPPPQDAGQPPPQDAGQPHDGGTVCTEDTCYECNATQDAGPVTGEESDEVFFAYNVWDLNDPNSRWPGCGSCGANNSYLACATNCCACNLGAAAGIAAIAVAWPTIAALGGLITEAGLAAFGALTTAEIAGGIAALGAAAAAFKPWANACLKCYCNVDIKYE
jgi:hypothetical protein